MEGTKQKFPFYMTVCEKTKFSIKNSLEKENQASFQFVVVPSLCFKVVLKNFEC